MENVRAGRLGLPGALVALACLASPFLVAASPATAEAKAPPAPPLQTRIELRYEHPVSLRDAIRVTPAEQGTVLAYRFENDQMAGEYSPQSGVSVDDYVNSMLAKLGTEPEVVGYVLAAPDGTQRGTSPSAVSVTGISELKAPPISAAFF